MFCLPVKPNPPRGLSVEDVSSRSLTLVWGSPAETYNMYYIFYNIVVTSEYNVTTKVSQMSSQG